MDHIPLNGQRVIEAVQSALRTRPSEAQLVSEFLDTDRGDAPDGTNGATKSERAVDPSQGMGAHRPHAATDPLLAAITKIVHR